MVAVGVGPSFEEDIRLSPTLTGPSSDRGRGWAFLSRRHKAQSDRDWMVVVGLGPSFEEERRLSPTLTGPGSGRGRGWVFL